MGPKFQRDTYFSWIFGFETNRVVVLFEAATEKVTLGNLRRIVKCTIHA